MSILEIKPGKKFGKLTLIEFVKKDNKRSGNQYWKFQCECGKITTTRLSYVVRGQTKSCGCLRKEYYRRLY